MTRAERLIDQLERAYQGDPWYGSSLTAILDGVTVEQARARPVATAHTIWELVLHLAGWKGEVLARLSGAPAGEPPQGDWPAVPADDDTWWAAKEALHSAHERLVAAVASASEVLLDSAVKDPRPGAPNPPIAMWQMLQGVLQHDIYHAGQIALLRKALAGR